MQKHKELTYIPAEPVKTTVKRFCVVVLFGIAFAYNEAAVVVYLREIFYAHGFTFPLTEFGAGRLWRRLLLIEAGREAATMVIIFTSCALFGRNRRQRFAYFLTIFAIWDIFYYLWLKILLDWPGSIMDWDILFLMPTVWAAPVLAPLLVSVTMLLFAAIILYRASTTGPIVVKRLDWLGFFLAALVIVVSFCIAGRYISSLDFRSHFYWPLFALGNLSAVALFVKCLLKARSI